MNSARFGPAGTAESFSAMGYKKTLDIPAYLQKFHLTAFEYQCGHGLRVNMDVVQQLGVLCKKADIRLSLHTPYYISLSSVDPEKREKSVGYILESAKVVFAMGGDRIVVHSGSCGKMPREEALALAKETLQNAQKALDENGLSDVHICPETMGKINQLGTLAEVLDLCHVDERFLPCIDFGHLNARTFGGIKGKEDFKAILSSMENAIGAERTKVFHSHFSKIQYTENGGEKIHLTFADTEYGPEFEPLAELLAEYQLTPTIICESAGTQAEDAATMREMYLDRCKGGAK